MIALAENDVFDQSRMSLRILIGSPYQLFYVSHLLQVLHIFSFFIGHQNEKVVPSPADRNIENVLSFRKIRGDYKMPDGRFNRVMMMTMTR